MVGVPTASAQGFGVADNCTTPTTGTQTAPNQPCWVAGVYSGDYSGTADTDYYTQSGGHPFVGVTDFIVDNTNGVPSGNVSNVRVDIPPGLISDPEAVPKCASAQPSSCPSASQLGVVRLEVDLAGTDQWLGASVYNMVPPPGKVSDYAFTVPVANTRTDIIGGIRSASDDGLFFTIAVPPSIAELVQSTLIFWGVPGDSAHQPDLGWSCASPIPGCTPPASGPSHPSGTPFITLPSGCLPPGQASTLTLTDTGGDAAQATSKTPVPGTGCSNVPFNPSVTLAPSTTQADAPTGLRVDLHVPQDEDGSHLATSTLQTAVVTLPPGMTLNPSAANALQACSPAQFGSGSDDPPTCPEASKLGTVEIDTPLLPNPLTGTVYLGCDGSSAQTPCTPATAGGPLTTSLYVYATAPAQGIDQKLQGIVSTDAASGQVTTTFANQPQVPFSDFILDFNSGPAAALANPLQCGPATATSSLVPYSGNFAPSPSAAFTVDANGSGGACSQPAPFAPGFSVSTHTLQAGAFDEPLTIDVTRADQQQFLSRITSALPPGLVGLLASVPECPDAQAAAGTCPATSRIGATTVLAGAGSNPITQAGTVYLTGPYAGAPFGLSIVVPAIAGPFDLGTVVVRAAVVVDRTDAHVTVVSDPLPQVVGGVPLRLRSVSVSIDRPGFLVNPTNCAALAIGATISSAQGATAAAASPFQATGCGALPFAPTIQMALTGKRQTAPGGHPRLSATVTSALGQANLRSTTVTLPLSLALDPNNSQHVCSVAASNADSCPTNTAIGAATVKTPLLSQPLTGTVYLVQGIRTNAQGQTIRTLPSLLIPLRGQVAIDVRGQTSVDSHSRLVTTFPTLPDAAVSRFTLTINGGRRGILVVTGHRTLCRGRQIARVLFAAQSGASTSLAPTISTPCGTRSLLKRVTVTGHLVRVTLSVPRAGRVRVGGTGLTTVTRRIAKGRTVQLVLHLTAGAASTLRKRGTLRTRVSVRYTPKHGRTQTLRTRGLTIRR